MRIVVTGSTGFIGRRLCARLLRDGHTVIGVARSTHTTDLLGAGLIAAPELARALFSADDPDLDSGVVLEGVEVVVHLAGDPNFGNGAHYERVNVEGTRRLAAVTSKYAPGMRAFVFASSLGAQDKDPTESLARAIDETSTAVPTTDYGRSKLEAERFLGSTDLPVRIARLGMVAGAEMRPGSHLAAVCELREKAPDRLLELLDGTLALVHVDDACAALELLATSPAADQHPYLVVADSVRVGDVVRVLAGRAPGEDVHRARFRALRRAMPFVVRSIVLPELRVDARRLRELGWKPEVGWRELVTEVGDRVRARHDASIDPGGWTVVTGAASGLGRAVAERLGPMRSRLLVVDRDADAVRELAASLGARALVADVAAESFSSDVMQSARADDSFVAEVFLCAGVGRKGEVGSVSTARELGSIDINLRARIATANEVLGDMRARHFGRIVLVASSSAFQALPEFASYSAANSGLLAFGQALATEVDGTGVQVLTVCPGGMDTNFQASSGVRRIENERLLDPADVADEMLHALDRGRVLAVVGMRARAMDVVGRVLPRPIQRRLWKRLVQGMR